MVMMLLVGSIQAMVSCAEGVIPALLICDTAEPKPRLEVLLIFTTCPEFDSRIKWPL